MAENTSIEWCDHTMNPWVGCTKVSPACDHCYAEGWAKRAGSAAGVVWGGERRRTSESTWRQPLKWNAQAQDEGRRFRVFCASLADVFDNQVPDEWRADLFTLIAKTPNLDWLLLTKRIGNAHRMIDLTMDAIDRRQALGATSVVRTAWPWPNVWIGATICDQAEADRDVPKLLATPAAVRFLSVEPMLGPIDLRQAHMAPVRLPRVDWVISGGESGPKARPMHPDWARGLRDQCAAAGVPFLFKQWGEWVEADRDGNTVTATEASGVDVEARRYDLTTAHGAEFIRVGKKAAGRLLDGRTRDEFPGC